MNPIEYDRTIIAFSGGKDSLACVLWAIENGCPNIELWHHLVDGREGSTLMDWPITEDYCRAIANALDLPIYFSWLEGGFEREMNRDNQKKARSWFETPNGLKSAGGNTGKLSTRKKFPQVSADLSVRWCSAYLKIDLGSLSITNQERFKNSKTLFITGERAEESAARAKYATFEPDRADKRDSPKLKRHVDRLRPIHGWNEEKVWEIIKRHRINPHPAYHLGWGRLSCMSCIFGSANQWASVRAIAPDHFERIADYENEFGVTIQRKKSVGELADMGTPYEATNNSSLIEVALSTQYTLPVFAENWAFPAGAFGENVGPT